METYIAQNGRKETIPYYRAPNENDLEREKKVLQLLQERFQDWQEKGYIPSRRIQSGYNTDQPIRERGWTYWHHLFNPRQMLTLSLFLKMTLDLQKSELSRAAGLLWSGKCCDWDSRLSRWDPSWGREHGHQTFSNQALNTLYNFSVKSFTTLKASSLLNLPETANIKPGEVNVLDARKSYITCDLWLTDPPYADAINYHELSEFYLAWYEKKYLKSFPIGTQTANAPLLSQDVMKTSGRVWQIAIAIWRSICQIMVFRLSCLPTKMQECGQI